MPIETEFNSQCIAIAMSWGYDHEDGYSYIALVIYHIFETDLYIQCVVMWE